jgi:hypothetical protein
MGRFNINNDYLIPPWNTDCFDMNSLLKLQVSVYSI